ncbi:hypothetical protein ABA45_15700 [Marinobacter psychrophilus]|uniref:Porin n=1 Tax=Marinobacter psychrophilus TaxID=330734 RepID=A0A0H4I7I1_9GAMM|nr:DcaP family trimeric outer membrane transporter [Marinobacter psychrophilus]AKO53693.1 hypothetical protein ABA45_15700 [Marinobacter psychrophilus]
MQSNKLRMAIRATAAVAVLSMAGPASAVDFTAGDYEMSVYGYARLNATYDIDEDIAGRGTRSGDFSKINVGADEDDEVGGNFGADALQSRLGFKVMTPEGVKIVVEGDFRGTRGDSTGDFRLRHAFGEYNGVLIGRYWSNYSSFVGNTSQLEFDGVPGNAGYQFRASQVRYTTGSLSVSLEEPSTRIASAGSQSVKTEMPAITARFESSMDSLSYSAAAIVRQVGYDTGTEDDSAIGVGAFVAAKLALNDTFSIQGQVNVSEGANGYLWRSGSNYYGQDAYIDSNGDLETISGYGANLGVSMKTGDGSSVNVVYGVTELDLDDAVADTLTSGITSTASESNSTAAINYQWSPVKNVNMGVQYAFHMVDKVNGDSGDASRIHFAAQYNF